MDSSVAPGRVFSSQPHNELAYHDCCWRPTATEYPKARIGPASCHQFSVPTQQRGRRHDPGMPPVPGEKSRQRGEQHSAFRLQARASDLTTQHCNSMAQHKQLNILGGFTAASWGDQAKETLGEHVDGRKQHVRDPPRGPGEGLTEIVERDKVGSVDTQRNRLTR